jgi:signal transduction histidine kinase
VSVRFRLALTVFLAGLAAALGVIVSVALAFQRFEHESNYQRADTFLSRVVAMHGDLLDQHERNPEELLGFLRSLVIYDPGSRLYLLDAHGLVLSSTSSSAATPNLTPQRVAMGPVREAALAAAQGDTRRAAYVMGEDPDQPGVDSVVAARPLGRTRIGPADPMAGYLYLVCSKAAPSGPRLALFGSSLAGPALASVLAVLALTTALAAWVIVTVTRPLQVLSTDVAQAAELGFSAQAPMHSAGPAKPSKPLRDDEFGRLRSGFHALLARLREQWDELRRLDSFRRESVSNLSHDLRSPLTATVACLETLESRWQGRADDLQLVQTALRNTRNAASMVRSLGDLALLDEPQFQLHKTRLDLGEVLDDITLRFAARAQQAGVVIQFEQVGSSAPVAQVDIELFERAVANLLDNALKFTPRGGHITLQAGLDVKGQHATGRDATVTVQDTGAGIPASDLPHLFDRLYQSRSSVAPATSEEGKGLGLAIVKRIAELHGGSVAVTSTVGQGTTVSLQLPC